MNEVLEKLRFAVSDFVLAPEKTIFFPPFKGNVFRGALGKALKDLTCAFKTKDCKECLIRDKCLYAQVFESHNTGSNTILKNIEKAPHPFIIFVPDKYRLEYPENDKIHFFLTLVGSAVEYISYFILAFEQIGKRGIGKNRSPFAVERVQVSGQNIYDPVEKRVQRVFPVFKGSDVLMIDNNEKFCGGSGGGFSKESPDRRRQKQNNVKHETLKIILETPMRIKFGGQFQKHLTFEMLAVNLLRRLQLLSAFYCGGPDLVDLSALIDKARRVKKAGENIFWQHQDRFSYRQEKNISMGGVSGWIEFAGEAAEFIPFLKLAEHLHIGKGTGLGLGKIGVDVLR